MVLKKMAHVFLFLEMVNGLNTSCYKSFHKKEANYKKLASFSIFYSSPGPILFAAITNGA